MCKIIEKVQNNRATKEEVENDFELHTTFHGVPGLGEARVFLEPMTFNLPDLDGSDGGHQNKDDTHGYEGVCQAAPEMRRDLCVSVFCVHHLPVQYDTL